MNGSKADLVKHHLWLIAPLALILVASVTLSVLTFVHLLAHWKEQDW